MSAFSTRIREQSQRNATSFFSWIRRSFGDLSGLNVHAARVGLFEADIFHDAQFAVPHGTADVQLSLRVRRQQDIRILDVAFHLSFCVGSHGDAADRAVADKLQCQQVFIVFEVDPHHKGGRHRASQRRGGDGAQRMPFSGLFRNAP